MIFFVLLYYYANDYEINVLFFFTIFKSNRGLDEMRVLIKDVNWAFIIFISQAFDDDIL
jgi:hypothetical protein